MASARAKKTVRRSAKKSSPGKPKAKKVKAAPARVARAKGAKKAAPAKKKAVKKPKTATRPKGGKKASAPRPPQPAKQLPASKPKPVMDLRVQQALEAAEIEGLIMRLPPPLQPVVRSLRKLMLDVAPEAKELLEGDSAAYSANGIFARIEPTERVVLVRFLKGGALPSAQELEGQGEERALTLSSAEGLRESVLRTLVREAVMLNLGHHPSA